MKFRILIILYFSNIAVFGQTAKYSNDFMHIGIGAKWMGMGNTGTAGSLDVSAAYWNPAGLLGLQNNYQVEALHASYFAGMASYNHIGLGNKSDSSTALAFSILRFGVDDIPNTTDLIDENGNVDYSRLKSFSVADYAFLFSLAKVSPVPNLWIGGNAKLIYRNVGKFAKAWGFGIDVSAKYFSGKWNFGATLKDATSTFNFWSFNADELEITIGDSTFNTAPGNNLEVTLPELSLGVNRLIHISNNYTICPEINIELTFDGERNTIISNRWVSCDPHLGIEVAYKNLISIRAGFNNLQWESNYSDHKELILQPSIGMGIRFKAVSLDYAMTNAGSVGFSRYSNIFSISYRFDSFTRHK